MPPILDQIVLANRAVAQPGGTLDLYGASWDTLETPAVPIQQEQFALFLSLLLTPEEARTEHQIRVGITAPSGTGIGYMVATVTAGAEPAIEAMGDDELGRAETVLEARGVVYPEFGTYELSILWDGTPLREPMRINVVEANLPGSSA